MKNKLKYSVVVEESLKYEVEVSASNEEEAYELARGIVADGEAEHDEDPQHQEISVVCLDEDYEEYINDCEELSITPLGKDEDYLKHHREILMEQWYSDYVDNDSIDLDCIITDSKEKKSYLSKCRKDFRPLVMIREKNSEINLYLDLTNLREKTKRVFNYPCVSLRHDNIYKYVSLSIDNIIKEYDFVKCSIVQFTDEQLEFVSKKNKS